MEKKIAIIGAGIAGLSAGCYGRMNGYDTEIFEMHTVPGGVYTGWVRKGYTFDGCLHWLTGSAPGNPYYQIWEELGALKGKKIINHEAFCHIVTATGTRLIQYGDLDRLADELKKIGPEDSAQIDRIRADARRFGMLRMPVSAPKGLLNRLEGLRRILPYLPLFRHYGGMSVEKLAPSFKSPALQDFLLWSCACPTSPRSGCSASSRCSIKRRLDGRKEARLRWPDRSRVATWSLGERSITVPGWRRSSWRKTTRSGCVLPTEASPARMSSSALQTGIRPCSPCSGAGTSAKG